MLPHNKTFSKVIAVVTGRVDHHTAADCNVIAEHKTIRAEPVDFREIFKFYVLPAGDVFPMGDLDALTYKEQSFGLLEEKPLAPPERFWRLYENK